MPIDQPPPPTPRALTRRVRRRAWAEPSVRFWLLAAFALAGICIYILLAQTWRWTRERRLIEEGTVVAATVIEAGGEPVAGKQMPPTSSVRLQFQHDAQTLELAGYLAGRKEFIPVGGRVAIRIDPQNPQVWTARTEPTPLVRHLVGGFLVLPAAALALGVAMLRRRKVLRVWRDGHAVSAAVLDLQRPAIAPRSLALRCAPQDPADNRIFTVYLPKSLAQPQPGDVLWIVRPMGGIAPALAAAALDDRTGGMGKA